MASLAGLTGVANLAAYVAGKAVTIGLTKAAALNCASPPPWSGSAHRARPMSPAPSSDRRRAGRRRKKPRKYRPGQPMQAAN
jgi:hypothetical protein